MMMELTACGEAVEGMRARNRQPAAVEVVAYSGDSELKQTEDSLLSCSLSFRLFPLSNRIQFISTLALLRSPILAIQKSPIGVSLSDRHPSDLLRLLAVE